MSTHLPSHWKSRFYLWGHIAKGIVYLLIGGLALATLVGEAGGPGGPQEVMRFIQQQPFGKFLLVVLALGFACYAAWRWTKALTDAGNDGNDAEGMTRRTGYALSGTLYALLAVYSIGLLTGGGSEASQQSVISEIMSNSWGRIVMAVLALAALIAAFFQFKIAFHEEYMDELHTSSMDRRERRIYEVFAKLGYYSRTLVYGIIAYFLIRVALRNLGR